MKNQECVFLWMNRELCTCISPVCKAVMQMLSDTREESEQKCCWAGTSLPYLLFKLPGALTLKNSLISSTVDLVSHQSIRHPSAWGKRGELLLKGRNLLWIPPDFTLSSGRLWAVHLYLVNGAPMPGRKRGFLVADRLSAWKQIIDPKYNRAHGAMCINGISFICKKLSSKKCFS